MYQQLHLSWMLHIPVDSGSRQIDDLLSECKGVERFAYVYHEPWGMRPHFHLYLKFSDLAPASYIKKHFGALLAYPGETEANAIRYLLKDSEPSDVKANFSIQKYIDERGEK